MVPLALGGSSVSKLYLGDTEVSKAYLGGTEVHSGVEPFVGLDFTIRLGVSGSYAGTGAYFVGWGSGFGSLVSGITSTDPLSGFFWLRTGGANNPSSAFWVIDNFQRSGTGRRLRVSSLSVNGVAYTLRRFNALNVLGTTYGRMIDLTPNGRRVDDPFGRSNEARVLIGGTFY